MKTIGGNQAAKSATIAICGNPNCGKTTIFNAITGLSQHVGNYSGVTVEKVVGNFTSPQDPSQKFDIVDIPGTYSLSAFTPDEYIAASALFGDIEGEKEPDAIITVIDATNLERGLYFLLQILEIGKPTLVVLNMIDLARRRGIDISCEKLSKALGGVPVIEVIGNKAVGIDKLKVETTKLVEREKCKYRSRYDDQTEHLIERLIEARTSSVRSRAHALRVVFDVSGEAEKRFVNESSEEMIRLVKEGRDKIKEVYGSLYSAETGVLTKKAAALYEHAVTLVKTKPMTKSERIDRVILHPFLGPVILAVMMVFVFQAIFSWAEPFMNLIDSAFGLISGLVQSSMAEGPLRSLLTDGIIGGVGSVLVFIPQIVFLFIFIAVLEDSGYMPRAAFLVDRMFRWCGLSGKSFIPMLSSFACAVPGIMATRTIEDRKLRLITIMVAPLMTCSARLPVYAIMIAAFIPYKLVLGFFNLQGLVLTMLYMLGIVVAIIVSFVLKKTIYKTERGTFLMELPTYKVPTFKSVFIRVFNRVKSFVIRAGTVIMAITIVIWALSYYPRSTDIATVYDNYRTEVQLAGEAEADQISQELASFESDNPQLITALESLASLKSSEEVETSSANLLNEYPQYSAQIEKYKQLNMIRFNTSRELADLTNQEAGAQIRHSYFGLIGKKVEPLFKPLGWDWKITMSVLASFPAREVIIAVIGTIYNLGTDVDEESSSLIEKMRQATWEDGNKVGQLVFTPAVALSIMVFFALCCQCGATLVTIKQETASWFYSVVTFTYMTTLAYISAFVVYQVFSGIGL